MIIVLLIWATPCYAQEQYIAESFGLYSKAVEYYRSGKLYEAKEILERAVRLDPRNDEAQGYLDLVNAEIKMRAKGRLGYYQEPTSIEREIESSGIESDNPEYYAEIEPEESIESPSYRQGPDEGFSEVKKGRYENRLNEVGTSPLKVTGDIRLAVGITSEDIIWKDANADNVGVPFEKNWRYMWGDDRYNTYDKKIYDRLRLNINTDNTTGLNAYLQIAIDPWTFVGKEDVHVTSTTGGDFADIELKYWSNTRRTINEIYRTNKGNIINLKEIKIVDGKTTLITPTGIHDWHTDFNSIPSGIDIDWRYMPIRKLWVDYKNDDESFNSRLFLKADQSQALTSDDPLRLSNNHVYWEESPWLDEYEPSRLFYRDDGTVPVKRGRWIRRLSFFTKDSDQERLTFLRGLSINGTLGISSYGITLATPMSLWDDYENCTSIPLAFRSKTEITPDLTLGSIYTFKGGMNRGTLEAQNHVLGFDAGYNLIQDWQAFGEIAGSKTDIDEANGMESSYDGFAYAIGLKNSSLKTKFFAAYMEQDFYPGLSNYRYTRRDQFYSKHINFSEMPQEDKYIAIGDGIDRGRITLGVETIFPIEGNLVTQINARNVHNDSGKYIESVVRTETTYKLYEHLTLKGLAMYQHLPKTKAGYDPLIYAKTSYAFTDYYSDTDIFLENSKVVDGKDPSIGSFGIGTRYEFDENLAWEGIYERTNDPNDCPRGLLNDSYVTAETKDGMLLDKMVPFLYDQGFFDLPPYDYYDIYKTKLIYKPFSKLTGILSYTRNVNKHAIGLDDNVNHIGLELDYRHTEKLSFGFKYIYTKLIDVYRQNKGEGVYYDGHHNIFAQIDYNIDADQRFSILFGEFVAYAPIEDLYQPAKWSLSSLDTQHIVRMYYNRKF